MENIVDDYVNEITNSDDFKKLIDSLIFLSNSK